METIKELIIGEDYLHVDVYENKSIGNCSNGGATSIFNSLYLFKEGTKLNEIQEFMKTYNYLTIDECFILDSKPNGYKFIKPVKYSFDDKKWVMFGGAYVMTSDSRFKELTGSRQPLPVHDRIEDY